MIGISENTLTLQTINPPIRGRAHFVVETQCIASLRNGDVHERTNPKKWTFLGMVATANARIRAKEILQTKPHENPNPPFNRKIQRGTWDRILLHFPSTWQDTPPERGHFDGEWVDYGCTSQRWVPQILNTKIPQTHLAN
jgi:hypothetical protein